MNLYKHQVNILAKSPSKIALVWEMGTAKTRTAIEFAKKNNAPTLIICPKGLVENWKRECKIWEFTGSYLIISKETFRRDWEKLNNYPLVIVDEAHHFLGTKSQMMKSLLGYFKKWDTKYRWLLSGTVYRSSPMDIFVLAKLLDRHLNYISFTSEFFYNIKMGSRLIPMAKTDKTSQDKLIRLIKNMGDIVKMEDCIDMPPAIYETEYFELTKSQKEGIENLTDFSPIVRFTKIHQICGGTLKGDEYNDEEYYQSDKQDRLIEIVNDVDKLIVVCRYNNELNQLSGRLIPKFKNKKIRIINGSVKNRDEILQELNKAEQYVLLVNSSCSEGWELPNCSHMVFYSQSFALKDKIQMEARIRRINNPKRVWYKTLVVAGTIDEDIYKTLEKKQDFHLSIYAKKH